MSTLITQTIEIIPNSPYVQVQIVSVESDLPPLEAYASLALFAADGAQRQGHTVWLESADDVALVIEPGNRRSTAMYIVPDGAVRRA